MKDALGQDIKVGDKVVHARYLDRVILELREVLGFTASKVQLKGNSTRPVTPGNLLVVTRQLDG